MSFRIVAQTFGMGMAIVVACGAGEAVAGTYDRFGVSDQDVALYEKAAASIPACAAAHVSDRDPLRPSGNPQYLMHLASLYGQCGDVLRKRHVSLGVTRTNDLFLTLKCSALDPATGGYVSAPACSVRPVSAGNS